MATHQPRTESRDRPRTFSGRDARQGEIVLRTPLRRAIFIAGLVGIVALAFVLSSLVG
jgi:hypothetical protein